MANPGGSVPAWLHLLEPRRTPLVFTRFALNKSKHAPGLGTYIKEYLIDSSVLSTVYLYDSFLFLCKH